VWLSAGEGSAQQSTCASLGSDGRPQQTVNPPPPSWPMPGLVQDMATTDGGPSASLTRLCVVVESTGSMAGTWPGLRCFARYPYAALCLTQPQMPGRDRACEHEQEAACQHSHTWDTELRLPDKCRSYRREPYPVGLAHCPFHTTHTDATSTAAR